MSRKEIFELVKNIPTLRRRLTPYLTEQNDPYFDTFLAVTCFALPQNNLEKLVKEKLESELLEELKKYSICEIGKGAYSRSFRIFGRKYLAVTEPNDPAYPDAPSPREYEGTVVIGEQLNLENYSRHMINGRRFDITLSNSLLGDLNATNLKPVSYERGGLETIRDILTVFSKITKRDGISVHRCDYSIIQTLVQNGFLGKVDLSIEAYLRSLTQGGFIEDETIAVLRKT